MALSWYLGIKEDLCAAKRNLMKSKMSIKSDLQLFCETWSGWHSYGTFLVPKYFVTTFYIFSAGQGFKTILLRTDRMQPWLDRVSQERR